MGGCRLGGWLMNECWGIGWRLMNDCRMGMAYE